MIGITILSLIIMVLSTELLTRDLSQTLVNFNVGVTMMNPTATLEEIREVAAYIPTMAQVELFKKFIVTLIIISGIIALISFSAYLKERKEKSK